MPAVPDVAKLDVNLDENVDGSPYDFCLWHEADHLDGVLRGQLLTQSGPKRGERTCCASIQRERLISYFFAGCCATALVARVSCP
jgi:hypothetical protein